MKLTPNFYRDRVCLNVLAGSKDNARKNLRGGGRSRTGRRALQKNYPDVASAVADMREYAKLIDNALSVGLGAGDPKPVGDGERDFSPVQPQHVNRSSPAWLPAARCSGRMRPW